MEKAVDLCAYCHASPPDFGGHFCCEGCQILASLEGFYFEGAATPEDHRIARDFGRASGERIEFECAVEPLACEACLQALARLPESYPAVKDLEWSRAESVLRFQFAKDSVLPAGFFQLLRRLKLNPRWRETGSAREKSKFLRMQVIRAGITGALAGNIMMFAVPIYGGLDGPLRTTFEWIQAALFVPVFLWSAIPVFRAAWLSAKLKHLSVDLPLALAFTLGSVLSFAALARGGHDIYFDSLAGFLFLILASRLFLEKSLAGHLRAPKLGEFFERPHYVVTRNGREEFLPWRELAPGDELQINAGDRLPVDGVLLTRSAEVDTSWMTGEVLPNLRLKGAPIQAGARLVSTSAQIRVTAPAAQTEFARIVERLESSGEKLETGIEAQAGSLLVLACLVAVAGLFLFAGHLGAGEIFRRSLAVLIVACPCAVSFAAPLARARASRLARRRGFWIRRPHVWKRLSKPERIAFDKTGTLTEGNLSVAPHSPMIDVRWKQIILSLENVSFHPVAESLRRTWGALDLFEVHAPREIPGEGVEGVIQGEFYEFKKVAAPAGVLRIALKRGGRSLTEVELVDLMRPRTREAFLNLAREHQLFIISGDAQERVHQFADAVELPRERALGNLSPEEKARALARIHPDLYFGDGTNDVLALKSAPVSFATGGAALEAKAAADVLMLDSGIEQLPLLFAIARATDGLIRRNFAIAIAYNSLAGVAALAGAIHPLVAAVLMPAISVVLAGSTLYGTAPLRALDVQP